jgi:hypothetical protein
MDEKKTSVASFQPILSENRAHVLNSIFICHLFGVVDWLPCKAQISYQSFYKEL